ncbi:E3 ubiquitin-protein ligase ZNRF1 isoform X2 [Eumetopias jubatus]|uniref:E3 ubiquitin-protein ligase ZNRF1 isoform X2 n=1 Tax=Eumetopias jubatus TaxID=34886 RepID=UPI001016EE1A|nr:E3 ubiquitin-protein ligase ZNRF1 isoform X2 [Eumetopias jubatus]
MGGKQSTAARSRGPFPGVSTDDSAVPPPGGAPHFGHYRAGGGAMGLRSRSVSSVAGMGMDPSTAGGVPFGLYTPASRGTGDSERAPGGGGSASDSTYAHGNGYQETGGGHHRDGMLYLGSRASLADALPLHIAPRWFSSHSGFKCPICSKSVASDEMEMHFIMCLSKPRLSYNGGLNLCQAQGRRQRAAASCRTSMEIPWKSHRNLLIAWHQFRPFPPAC